MEIYLSIFKEIKYLNLKNNLTKSPKSINGNQKGVQIQVIKVQRLIQLYKTLV
jgi:hypothetical protein